MATNTSNIQEANAAYRLGRDRYTLQIWQELAWTWSRDDAAIVEALELSLEELVGWREQLRDVLDPCVAIDVRRWVEVFRHKWQAYYGTEQHDRDVGGEGTVIPTDLLLARNPFYQDMLNLQRLTERTGLFHNGHSEVAHWFAIGSLAGRCEYLVWVGSAVSDEALLVLSKSAQVPGHVRQHAQSIRETASTLQFNAMLKLHECIVEIIQGHAADVNPTDYDLALVATTPPQVYFRGTRITSVLHQYESRILRAFAERPGQPIPWDELLRGIDSETSVENLKRYVSRLLQKIAKDCSAPNDYAEFRKWLKDECFPTDQKTGFYLLNMAPSKVLIRDG